MTFKEFFNQQLNEMPAWDDSNKYFQNVYKPNGKWISELKKITQNNPIEIVKHGNYDIKLYEVGNQIHCVAMLGQTPVGDIHCTKMSNMKSVPVVNSVGVAPEHQKNGIGRKFYEVLLNKYHCLMSGGTLTGETGKGSYHIWESMEGVNKYITRREPDGKWTFTRVREFTKADMNDPYSRFFVCNEDIKKLINVYDNGEYLQLKEDVLTEMPMWNDAAKVISSNFKDPDINQKVQDERRVVASEHKPVSVEEQADFVFEIYKPSDYFVLCYALNNEGKVIGEIDAQWNNILDFPMVRYSAVDENFQGKGVAKGMYNFLIKTFGGLVSDLVLTGKEGTGSIDIWGSIGKGRNCYVMKMIPHEHKHVFTVVKNFDRSLMKDTENGKFERFVVSDDPIQNKLKVEKTPTGFVFKK